jgi:hypothetical protein
VPTLSPCPVTWWKIGDDYAPILEKSIDCSILFLSEVSQGKYKVETFTLDSGIVLPLIQIVSEGRPPHFDRKLAPIMRQLSSREPTWELYGVVRERKDLQTGDTFTIQVGLALSASSLMLHSRSRWYPMGTHYLTDTECIRWRLPYWIPVPIVPTRFEREDVI